MNGNLIDSIIRLLVFTFKKIPRAILQGGSGIEIFISNRALSMTRKYNFSFNECLRAKVLYITWRIRNSFNRAYTFNHESCLQAKVRDSVRIILTVSNDSLLGQFTVSLRNRSGGSGISL